MTYDKCPECGGTVELDDGIWFCVTPGSCTWCKVNSDDMDGDEEKHQ